MSRIVLPLLCLLLSPQVWAQVYELETPQTPAFGEVLDTRNPLMIERALRPSVQILTHDVHGRESRGSGVALQSVELSNKKWRNFILTNFHVAEPAVRRGYPDFEDRQPLKIVFHNEDGDVLDQTKAAPVRMEVIEKWSAAQVERRKGFELDNYGDAVFLSLSFQWDLAFLYFDSDLPLKYTTQLAPREELGKIGATSQIMVVGYPLGLGPHISRGQLTIRDRDVKGQRSMRLTTAPIVPGNSGGGVFLSPTYHLYGIVRAVREINPKINITVRTGLTFRKVVIPPQLAPHVGTIIPAETIYQWLKKTKAHPVIGRPKKKKILR